MHTECVTRCVAVRLGAHWMHPVCRSQFLILGRVKWKCRVWLTYLTHPVCTQPHKRATPGACSVHLGSEGHRDRLSRRLQCAPGLTTCRQHRTLPVCTKPWDATCDASSVHPAVESNHPSSTITYLGQHHLPICMRAHNEQLTFPPACLQFHFSPATCVKGTSKGFSKAAPKKSISKSRIKVSLEARVFLARTLLLLQEQECGCRKTLQKKRRGPCLPSVCSICNAQRPSQHFVPRGKPSLFSSLLPLDASCMKLLA